MQKDAAASFLDAVQNTRANAFWVAHAKKLTLQYHFPALSAMG